MSEASPRPWTMVENSWQYTTIYDANGDEVCRLDLERFEGLNEDTQEHYEAIQRADAQLIVTASQVPHDSGQRWSKDRPTVPGWYWYKGGLALYEVEAVYVYEDDGVLFVDTVNNYSEPVSDFDGEWQGPITLND